MIQKFKKKPVIIEAVQYDNNKNEIEEFVGTALRTLQKESETFLFIDTLEGTMRIDPDDYVIKGVHGEFYPCKPDIFEETYELA